MDNPAIQCPIWHTRALRPDQNLNHYWSRRAGGHYRLLDVSANDLNELENDERARLTTWISDQNRMGIEPVVSCEVLAKVKSAWKPLLVSSRLDRLMIYLSERQADLDDSVAFDHTSTLDDRGSGSFAAAYDAEARCECQNWEELEYLISALINSGYVEELGELSSEHSIRITPRGHARLAELAVANQSSTQAFVAMWFNSSVQSAYDDGVAKAIEDTGYKPLRIDRKEHNNKIDDEIIAEIRRSRFLVADMTCEPGKPRGGVYFEAGFAMGLNIPVIWTCHEDAIAEVHFDTRQFAHILWKDAPDLRDKLAKRIAATIGDGPNKRP